MPHDRLPLHTLQQQLKQYESQVRPGEVLSTGSPALDALLPQQGLRRGTLIELLGEAGSGRSTLALLLARGVTQGQRTLVIVDPERTFYPLALPLLRCDWRQALFVRPQNHEDHVWSWTQALQCKGVGAVLGWPRQLEDRAFRRWQLAAEASESVGLLVRPLAARGHPSWAELQLLIEALPRRGHQRRIRVELIRTRTLRPGAWVELELDDVTATLHESRSLPVAAELAAATPSRRATRA